MLFLTVNLILKLIVGMCGESRNLNVKSMQFLSNSHPPTDRLTCKEGRAAEREIIGRNRQPH